MPKCDLPECDNDVEEKVRGGWKLHCSIKCRSTANSNKGNEKRKATCLARYGSSSYLKTDEYKVKAKATLLANYGVDHPMHSPQIKDKIKQTNIDTYGVDNPSKSAEIKQKKIATSIANYGVDHPLQSDKVQADRRIKSVEIRGVDHYSKTDEYKEKFLQTSMERYGVSNPAMSDLVKDKIKDTWNKNYGNIHPAQRHMSSDTVDKLKNPEWLDQNKELSSVYLAEQLGVTYYTILYAYNKYGIVRTESGSAGENSVAQFIRDNYKGQIILNSRNIIAPKEIDIYLPDLNLAIEYNGIFWHSELHDKDKHYHKSKTDKCKAQGIRLIHIFEDEWENKQAIVKSRIMNLLGCSAKIYARKCNIVTVTSKQSKEFLQANHIQGYATSSVQYGLEYNNELVALMTFGKSRYNKSFQWELIRFANKIGCGVVGAASRLLSKFKKELNPESMISYSDERWNTGNVYNMLGFTHTSISAASYKYTKDYIVLENRVRYQKHKLSEILDTFDNNLSEWENMKNNGYDRIWDCGNSVYVWNHHAIIT